MSAFELAHQQLWSVAVHPRIEYVPTIQVTVPDQEVILLRPEPRMMAGSLCSGFNNWRNTINPSGNTFTRYQDATMTTDTVVLCSMTLLLI